MACELWFYHLEKSPLVEVLPELLEKTLSRGWRALVRSSSEDRITALDQMLWTWRDDSFTPHGLSDQPSSADQPVLLSVDHSRDNDAHCLFLLDGATLEEADSFERAIVLFDGTDEIAVNASRALWKQASKEGRSVSYWRQSPEGRWEKKA